MNPSPDPAHVAEMTELRSAALHWLSETDAVRKAAGVKTLAERWRDGALDIDPGLQLTPKHPIPGRPARPELVSPLSVSHRSMRTIDGRAAMIHALAHIEFNAINLALDAVWRFPGMPQAYYTDWLKVAAEEALHFSLLADHLVLLGYAYGHFPAHNSLWDMAEKTAGDVLARMALVPRTMEARGLDASPPVRAKLAQAGDLAAAAILDIILRDEIGHVAIGNHWFGWLCTSRELEPLATYAALAQQYRAPALRGPFNMEARKAAGFSEAELRALRT
ncbi:MAG TPA: ferritin-like domain-containing protein [Noviherbaspirillum sp.]|uniref:ferritin-like domain-containing protein n=1 Tax=Noviherbaspirillum sp. TaxID=1926288 RepID=UPI002B4655A6|nr:ferritin-like domain-containing protein [Noviherbaspirillum sp.]HJV88300.1 ferritin-like domain-containing protein [Noviherbaspirillum sp.]